MTSSPGAKPRHEPEVLAANSRKELKSFSSPTPKVLIDEEAVFDVRSRYDVSDEIKLMKAAVLSLPLDLRRIVLWIDCDSSVHSYEVNIKSANRHVAHTIGELIGNFIFNQDGGHFGIYISDKFSLILEIDGYWGENPDVT